MSRSVIAAYLGCLVFMLVGAVGFLLSVIAAVMGAYSVGIINREFVSLGLIGSMMLILGALFFAQGVRAVHKDDKEVAANE